MGNELSQLINTVVVRNFLKFLYFWQRQQMRLHHIARLGNIHDVTGCNQIKHFGMVRFYCPNIQVRNACVVEIIDHPRTTSYGRTDQSDFRIPWVGLHHRDHRRRVRDKIKANDRRHILRKLQVNGRWDNDGLVLLTFNCAASSLTVGKLTASNRG